jgi:hypothetical protein
VYEGVMTTINNKKRWGKVWWSGGEVLSLTCHLNVWERS